jgi:threonylcarbamoyladenosine tRNA methylthiotransferase MtaB
MPGFHVENFGCRAARADGEAISDRLRAAGHDLQQPNDARVIIVNTCSVTAEADREARAYIRRVHRQNPEARIVVTGCYAQREPEELAGMDGVAAVVGNSHKALTPQIAITLATAPGVGFGHALIRAERPSELASAEQGPTRRDPEGGGGFNPRKMPAESPRALAPEERVPTAPPAIPDSSVARLAPAAGLFTVQSLLSSSTGPAPIWADDRFAHSFLEEARVLPGSQTRPNLKIQEGCGNRCTFCVIPQTRGSSRSLPAASVLKQVNGFVAAGGKELVLSGINLGRWGRDLIFEQSFSRDPWFPTLLHRTQKDGAPTSSRPTLADLVRQIFRGTELPRLRLSSIEPMDWDEKLIGLMKEFGGRRLCRHAHLPLQSGSDAVLRRMHRRYRPWHYAEKVEALFHAAGPELTLGADVMAGFPGETDREFEETLELIRALPFGYLHLFPFSPRPGTRGWALHAESPVPACAVEERMAALRALATEKTRAHREQFTGRELEAITLHTLAVLEARGQTQALTENFLPVKIEGRILANRLVRVRVTEMNAEMKLEAAAMDGRFAEFVV